MKYSLFRTAISFVVLVMVVIAYAICYAMVAARSTNAADLETQIATKTQVAERLKSVRAALEELSGDEAEVQGYFVSNANIVSFIDTLQRRGNELGSKVNVLSVSAANTKSPTLTLTLQIQGPFSAVMRTVGAVEYAPYALTVSSLSVTEVQGSEASKVASWTANMTVLVGSTSATSTANSLPTVPVGSSATAPGAPAAAKGPLKPI